MCRPFGRAWTSQLRRMIAPLDIPNWNIKRPFSARRLELLERQQRHRRAVRAAEHRQVLIAPVLQSHAEQVADDRVARLRALTRRELAHRRRGPAVVIEEVVRALALRARVA